MPISRRTGDLRTTDLIIRPTGVGRYVTFLAGDLEAAATLHLYYPEIARVLFKRVPALKGGFRNSLNVNPTVITT